MNHNSTELKLTAHCEICGAQDFFIFAYPVHTGPLKKKLIVNSLRRYFINPIKFFARIGTALLPKQYAVSLRKRAWDPYKRLQYPKEIAETLKKIDSTTNLFKGRKIIICAHCELGTVYPSISEAELIAYYSQDYWVANLGEIEPAENSRTLITYDLLKQHLDFSAITDTLEFGSASAHLSRYLKTREPQVQYDCVDPGILWQDLLKESIRNIYSTVEAIPGTYDLIISSHALEHVSSIQKYFALFSKLLNKNGYFYVEVPNSEERDLIFGPDPDYHIPHTYFFTPQSFTRIAEAFGFEPIFIKTFSRSYGERFSGENKSILSTDEHTKGAYLRVLLKKRT